MAANVQVDSQILSLAKGAAIQTGLDPNVILAHWMSEEPINSISSWTAVGNNPAGIRKGNAAVDHIAVGQNASGFDQFYSPLNGVTAYVTLIKEDRNYAGVRDAIKTGDPQKELAAIAASGWDAGHYGGNGQNLFASYDAITGAKLQVNPQDGLADRPADTAEGADLSQKQKAQTGARVVSWLKDNLGIQANAWELGVMVLGSVGILILIILLVKPQGVV